MSLTITPLKAFPIVRQDDNLADMLLASLGESQIQLANGDILVFAQKIISKAEGQMVELTSVRPSAKANEIAAAADKDPRVVELILQESNEVLRVRPGTIIVEHRLGFVCANAGIDHSNVGNKGGEHDEYVLLLPQDPDASARRMRELIRLKSGFEVGVMVIDSHGRAWRNGTVGVCIGLSGLPALIDERGWKDLFGYTLRVTVVGVADELAAAASLVMGQAAEGVPLVHVRGFPYPLGEGSLKELIRPREQDLFR